MKQKLLKCWALFLCCLLLFPLLPVSAEEGTPLEIKRWQEQFYEDMEGKTLADLQKGNDKTNKSGNKTPINNLYDPAIVGDGYTSLPPFPWAVKS